MSAKSDTKGMQIGSFARRAGVSVRAVRYYEELGLLRPSDHSAGGFRLYDEENLKRAQVIGFLKEVGLSLDEIRRIFTAKRSAGGDRKTAHFLRKTLGDKLAEVEAKIEALNRAKTEMRRSIRILESCECCDHEVLLDAILCGNCSKLEPRDSVPETFEVILQ